MNYDEVTAWLRENHRTHVDVFQQGAAWSCSCGAGTGSSDPKGGVTNKTQRRALAGRDRHLQAARRRYWTDLTEVGALHGQSWEDVPTIDLFLPPVGEVQP